MVKTRGGVNTSGKATKGKKDGKSSDDASRVAEPPVVEVEAQNVNGSIPPVETTQEAAPQIHIFYLPWVYYTNVQNLDNPRPEGFGDSSCADVDDVADVSEHTTAPSVGDSKGKTAELTNIYVNVNDVGIVIDNPKEGDVNMSSVGDIMTEVRGRPSSEDLVENVTPSVRDTYMDDVEVMGFYVPSATGTEDVIARLADNDVAPSVVDINAEEVEIPENAGQENKKSKKRNHKSGAERRNVYAGEPSEPKKKLSKEEKAAKKARRTTESQKGC
ncbi:hypothetical protein LIER_19436 [Lithospermum erythrorhizon]|uniref:Uncharacterized protein n=1 Tax=Lithospermum erythrorhizon TaxID=34254 RepID=A0AAV3QHT0_LITER